MANTPWTLTKLLRVIGQDYTPASDVFDRAMAMGLTDVQVLLGLSELEEAGRIIVSETDGSARRTGRKARSWAA